MRRLAFFLAVLLTLSSTSSYKILVYNSKFGHSHSTFLGRIADILVEAGHNVTSLIPIKRPSLADGTTKSHVIHVQQTDEVRAANALMDVEEPNVFETGQYYYALIFDGLSFGRTYAAVCKSVLDEPGLVERLRGEHYDVFINENFDMCGMGLSHLIQPKSVIGSSTCGLIGAHYDEFVIPKMLSFDPSPMMVDLDVHSPISRFWNVVGEYLHRVKFAATRSEMQKVFYDRFGPDYPSLEELSSHVAYVFANAEPLIDYATPTTSRIVPLGGIGVKQPQPLNEEWSAILSRRPRTVLISFGSVAASTDMPEYMRNSILEMIAAFPDITFIWKYEEPEDEFGVRASKSHANLVLAKWTPQNDLLNDDRIVAFFTHAGMGSIQETAASGTPGIFIPLFGDQPRNAGMMQYNRLGKVFDKKNLGNAQTLVATLKEILNNPKYRTGCLRVSRMLKKKPFAPRDLVVKYVEFAAEFGPSSALRPVSADMNVIEYYNIDVFIGLFIVILFVTYALFTVGRAVLNCCTSTKKKRD